MKRTILASLGVLLVLAGCASVPSAPSVMALPGTGRNFDDFRYDDASGGSAFSIQLTGESTERLAEISQEVAHRLSSVPGLEAVRSEAGTGDQEVQVIVDRARAAQLGLTTQAIAMTVAGAMRGDLLPELRTSDREVKMRLAFRESDRQPPAFDGHHIQIYIADFSGPYRKLLERGLITREDNPYQYRFCDIVDPADGRHLFTVEHEVRSATHPMYMRPLINRNPAQTNRTYAHGHEQWPWAMAVEPY